MQLNIDTKEKFHLITLVNETSSATLTDETLATLQSYLHNNVKNVVFNIALLEEMDVSTAEQLVFIQQQFYEQGASFVICSLSKKIEAYLDSIGLLEVMNITPTESEAYDIVQMEEIERELLGD